MNNTKRNLQIKGAILAGGRARRMGGVPKGALLRDGRLSLVERLLIQTEDAGIDETVIVTNEPFSYAEIPCEIIPDLRRNMGPVAGIEAALNYFGAQCDAVLILPCDLPEISANEMSTLLDAFAESDAPVVFAETRDGHRHSLCAVVATDLRTGVSAAIDAGTLRVGTLWVRLGGTGVVFDNVDAFTNLNSVIDVSAWRAGKRIHAAPSRSEPSATAPCPKGTDQCGSIR